MCCMPQPKAHLVSAGGAAVLPVLPCMRPLHVAAGAQLLGRLGTWSAAGCCPSAPWRLRGSSTLLLLLLRAARNRRVEQRGCGCCCWFR